MRKHKTFSNKFKIYYQVAFAEKIKKILPLRPIGLLIGKNTFPYTKTFIIPGPIN